MQAGLDPIEVYVNSHHGLDIASKEESRLAYDAWSTAKAGNQIGLGSCGEPNMQETKVFVLEFSGIPEEVCGDGWFAKTCIASRNNCVSSPYGIICDSDYLMPMYVLQQTVLSVNGNQGSTQQAHPKNVMLQLARINLLVKRNMPYSEQANEILDNFPWAAGGPEDDYDRIIVELATTGAVIFHELAHVEQVTCSQGHTDPRFIEIRKLLEMISCRLLAPIEVSADMRGMDAGAVGARMVLQDDDDPNAAYELFVRATIARLEYEAVVLPHPDYAVDVYTNEPKDPSKLERYYFDAGTNVPVFAGAGHIPPELRPVASIRLLRNRGFLTKDGIDTAFEISLRLRAFLTGVLWKRCHGKQNIAPEAIRDVINMLAFDRGPL
ncbi:MAG: hypothetical protein ABW104_18085 [Candidatus Thiodiazotropha sp. 6PLUC2]|nr:hypothetical protein [Candidatus Thiodiazotropha lotti]MCW4218795.1 hypothetical protein [Candidatus Thiodiazotropha lotti]